MKHFAVVGNPIAHSKSPEIHHIFAKEVGIDLFYEKVLSNDLRHDFSALAKRFTGMNVTVPFKFDAALLCDTHGESLAGKDARDSGAVNTLHFRDRQCLGYNTDGIGLVRDLAFHGVNLREKTLLILGAGGACAGILPALLREHPEQICITNRSFHKAQTLQTKHSNVQAITWASLTDTKADVIINTTSAGLAKQRLNVPDNVFSNTEFIYDLSYDLAQPTTFLTETAQYSIPQIDGFGMLIEQARESFQIWHDVLPNRIDRSIFSHSLSQQG